MQPASDRTVLISLLITIGLVFALIVWFVKLTPDPGAPLLWRDGPGQRTPGHSGVISAGPPQEAVASTAA